VIPVVVESMGVEKTFCGRVLLNRRKSAARRQAWRVPVLKERHSEDRVCWVPRGMWVTFSRSECFTSRAVVVGWDAQEASESLVDFRCAIDDCSGLLPITEKVSAVVATAAGETQSPRLIAKSASSTRL